MGNHKPDITDIADQVQTRLEGVAEKIESKLTDLTDQLNAKVDRYEQRIDRTQDDG